TDRNREIRLGKEIRIFTAFLSKSKSIFDPRIEEDRRMINLDEAEISEADEKTNVKKFFHALCVNPNGSSTSANKFGSSLYNFSESVGAPSALGIDRRT